MNSQKSVYYSVPLSIVERAILEVVRGYYGLSEVEFYNNMSWKKRDLVFARYVSMYFLKKYTRDSTTRIGQIFKKDHTTVIYGINRVKDLMDVYELTREDIRIINSVLNTTLMRVYNKDKSSYTGFEILRVAGVDVKRMLIDGKWHFILKKENENITALEIAKCMKAVGIDKEGGNYAFVFPQRVIDTGVVDEVHLCEL